MAHSSPPPSESDESEDYNDPRLEPTINAVNWDALSSLACQIYSAKSATWGEQLNGGYNVVRFLHLDDENNTQIVARVPYQPVDGMTDGRAEALERRIASEMASMEYVATHTRIPVPRVIAHNTKKDGGGIGSPYILMTKVEGAPLGAVWDDMEDEKREVILRQVIDIILQLSSVRFDSIGALFKGDGVTDSAWYIGPTVLDVDAESISVARAVTGRTYTSSLDYWVAYANANLESLDKENFGYIHKSIHYAMIWFLRSLIPSLYDTSLDSKGFPLYPGDFHSQNIMVADTDTPAPRITALIDWEFTSTNPTSSFAQYPLFIVDHPFWVDDHPLKPRNVRDQTTFDRLMSEAESKFDPEGGLHLSRAFANCQGVYLFEQCVRFPIMFDALLKPLSEYIFGKQDEDKEDFFFSYSRVLMNGLLKEQTERFKKEVGVKKEAVAVLGEELIKYELTRSEFKDIILENLNKFEPDGEVKGWLASCAVE